MKLDVLEFWGLKTSSLDDFVVPGHIVWVEILINQNFHPLGGEKP